MYKCNKCGLYKTLDKIVLKNGLPTPLCKICKNSGKRKRLAEKKLGTFLNKNSKEYRAAKFLIDAENTHGNLYRYDRVNYVDCNSHVEIFCTKHNGYFLQTPKSHTSGNGCFQCGITTTASKRKYTKEEYIALAKEVWGDTYEYDDIEYIDCFTEIKITCPVHGKVGVVPTQHLSGRGCKECAKNGYSIYKPGYLYVLANGNMTKVGITNTTPKDRCKVLSRKHDNDFQVIHSEYWEDGNIANDLETLLLRYLQGIYHNPDNKFHGWTETFLYVNRDDLLQKIEELKNGY